MKILILCWRDTTHPLGGGSEVYLEEISKRLTVENEILWFTAKHSNALSFDEKDSIKYFRKGNRLSIYLWSFLYLFLSKFKRGPFGKFSPDIIIDVQNGIPFFAKIFFPKKTILLIHHNHSKQWKVAGKLLGKIGFFIENKISPLIHKSSQIITVSNSTANDLQKIGFKKENIAIIPIGLNPIPTDFFTIKSSNPKLTVVSRLVPHKRIEDAINILDQLQKHIPNLTLDIIGDGWWKNELILLVNKLNLNSKVKFYGHLDEKEKYLTLSKSWLHILPSVKEGWGIVISEAGLLGIPSIGYSYSGGLNDSIENNISGLLAKDFFELKSLAKKILTDKKLQSLLGNGALLKAKKLNWDYSSNLFKKIIYKNFHKSK